MRELVPPEALADYRLFLLRELVVVLLQQVLEANFRLGVAPVRPEEERECGDHDVGALDAAGVEEVRKLYAHYSDGAHLKAGVLGVGLAPLLLAAVAQQVREKLCIFFYFQIILG